MADELELEVAAPVEEPVAQAEELVLSEGELPEAPVEEAPPEPVAPPAPRTLKDIYDDYVADKPLPRSEQQQLSNYWAEQKRVTEEATAHETAVANLIP